MNQDIYARLTEDLTPVTPISRRRCVALWLGFALGYIVMFVLLMGMRADIHTKLADAAYTLEMGLCSVLIIGTGVAAMLSALPGINTRLLHVGATLGAAAIGALVVSTALSMAMPGWWNEALNIGHLRVTAMLVGLSLPPMLWLLYHIKRAAPTHLRRTGMLTGLAASGCAYLILRLTMADDNLINVLLWCYLPMVALIALSYYTARLWLRW